MSVIDMHDAKTPLNEAIEKFERGGENEVLLARDGEPFAKIVRLPQSEQVAKRNPGVQGQSSVELGKYKHLIPSFTLEEWNESDEEIAELFGVKP